MTPSEFLADWLKMTEILGRKPEADPFIYVARSRSKSESRKGIEGTLGSYIGIRSFLVDPAAKESALEKLGWNEIHGSSRDHFDENGNYIFDEAFVEQGISLEPIVRRVSFEGLSITYSEPTERLLKYLQLHRPGAERKWINPWSEEEIIKTGDRTSSWKDHDEFVAIRRSEILDYLAARKKALLVVRYADRRFDSDLEIGVLPRRASGKIPSGYWTQYEGPSHFRPSNLYMRRAWETFWISPPAEPKRRDFPKKNSKISFEYVASNGETTAFEGEEDFFQIISLSSHGIKSLSKKANHSIEFPSLSTFTLHFPEGDTVHGSINLAGQFQTWLGDLARLPRAIQKTLSPLSEPENARPSRDFIDAQIHGEFPSSRPLAWTLAQVIQDLNKPWDTAFGETLLLSPAEADLPDPVGPTTSDVDELLEYALNLRKALIPEGKIEELKKKIDLSSHAASPKDYLDAKSISFTRFLFREFKGNDQPVRALKIINDLRQAKGHPKKVDEVLKDSDLKSETSRKQYFEILILLIDFLNAFREITSQVTREKLGGSEDAAEAWTQLSELKAYCQSVIAY